MTDDTFTHDEARFQSGDAQGGVDLSAAETKYAELFGEVIWDGLITTTNRQRLENARKVFGVSSERAEQIELSLTAAHESRTNSAIMIEADLEPESDGPVSPLATSDDPKLHVLQLRIKALEKDKHELDVENDKLRAHVEQLEELVEQLQTALQSTLEELDDVHEELDTSSSVLAETEKELEEVKRQSQPPPQLDRLPGLPEVPASLPKVRTSLPEIPEGVRSITQPRAAAPSEDDLDWSLPDIAAGKREDPEELHQRLDDDPRDAGVLHRLFKALDPEEQRDRRWCVAHTLVYLGEADDEQRELCAQHTRTGMIKPRRAVNEGEWRELLFHPTEDTVIGDVLGEIASAVLLGQLTEAANATLDEELRIDPTTSKVQAVRSFGWASKILGLKTPAIYVDKTLEAATEIAFSPTPSILLGQHALVGRTNKELAFLAGQQLCWFRKAHLLGQAAPSSRRLEDLLLAALSIGNPGLPMTEDVKDRVEPLVARVQPLLNAEAVTRLEGHFTHFVEGGGIADMPRWLRAVQRTALCSGLLLANDLDVAEAVLKLQQHKAADVELDELIVFFTAARCSKLRQNIGISV